MKYDEQLKRIPMLTKKYHFEPFLFGPEKDKLFCHAFVFGRGRSIAICDLVIYLQSKALNISWIYPGTIAFQHSEAVFAIQYSTLSLIGS